MNPLHFVHHPGLRFASAALVTATLVGLVAPASPAGAAIGAEDPVGGPHLAKQSRTVQLRDGGAPLPDVWAESWVLADADTGEILAHKGAHVKRAPASTLKMLTALTVLPQTDVNDTTRATKKAASTYGSRVGLKVGKQYRLDDLWHAVFLPSANDAAIAVAQANGSVKKTVRQMNQTARHLGALDTVAKTPNGLDTPGQVSSAYDLALIAREGLKNDDFARYAATKKASFPNTKGKGRHTIYTTNRMLLHGWKGAIGVKTGFTTKAGRTFAGAATRKGRTLIVTLMGIHEPTETAAKKLLSWGFKNADKVEPVGVLVEPGSVGADSSADDTTTQADSPSSSALASGEQSAAPTTSSAEGVSAAPSSTSQQGFPVLGILAGVLVAAGLGGLLTLRATRRGRHS